MNLLTALDKPLNTALEALRTPLTHKLFWVVSLTAYFAVLATLIYFFFIKKKKTKSGTVHWLIGHLHNQYAAALFAAYLFLYAFTSIVKQYAHRLRPDSSDLLSFPSRHAAFAFFIAFALPTKNKTAKTALYIWATLVAFSRLALAEHWLSDIVFGAGFGLIGGLFFKKVLKKLKIHAG